MRLSTLFSVASLGLGLAWAAPAHAQSLQPQPIPFSVWLDFDLLSGSQPPTVPLPIWLESVRAERPPLKRGEEEHTIYRLRLRQVGQLSRELSLRLFFEDLPGISPVINGWTETGVRRWSSGPLGQALGLSSSETVLIPAAGLDYLDVDVPGNGSTIRGLFLTSVQFTETRLSLDFPSLARGAMADPFGRPAPLQPAERDQYLLGRVQATLQDSAIRLTVQQPATWDLQLEEPPQLAVLTFEILNADLALPPELALNGQALGPVSLQLPDLADPAFRGRTMPGEADQRYHYTGWLRAQIILPGSAWQKGSNALDIVLSAQAEAVAIRAVEVQLKNAERLSPLPPPQPGKSLPSTPTSSLFR